MHRSALPRKLMTYKPTGGIVAAPTSSLPEQLGGPRNWDYRYTWIRDASFTLYALLRLGFTSEAEAFMGWLTDGVRGSAPVRVGNGAAEQLQLDIYGELMDSVYLYNKYGKPIYHETWASSS